MISQSNSLLQQLPPNPKSQVTTPHLNSNTPPQFEWLPCGFILREKFMGSNTYRSLQPTMELVSFKNDNQSSKIRLKVELDRPLQYHGQTGWTWHKSWIIPTIRMSVEFPTSNSKTNKVLPENCSFILRVVKGSSKNMDKCHMIDVGTIGNNVLPAHNGAAVFQGLKFTETSYKNQGSKFMFVATLRTFDEGLVHPEIIECLISSPIFIDSRRTARNVSGISLKNQSLKYNLQQFNPARLEETLVKRVKQLEEVITNSPEGLLSYLTAPNIRNKTKNPFFFFLRFSNALTMFYNSKHFEKNDLINQCMKKMNFMISYDEKLKSKKERKSVEGVSQKTLIVLGFNGAKELRDEIAAKLELTFGSLLLICILADNPLPQEFVQVSETEIRAQYEAFYNQVQTYEQQKQETDSSNIKQEYLIIRPIPYRPPTNSMIEEENEENYDIERQGERERQREREDEDRRGHQANYRELSVMTGRIANPVEIITYCPESEVRKHKERSRMKKRSEEDNK